MPFSVIKNITVVECSTFVTGPYAAALLADLGARVIKIESPPDGDPYRYFAPDPHFSFNFGHLNRNKASLALDLKSGKGKEICLDLLKHADVFVENFRPGTAERLGLGYETLHAHNRHTAAWQQARDGRRGLRGPRGKRIAARLGLGGMLCRHLPAEQTGFRYPGPGHERSLEPPQRPGRSEGDGHGSVRLRDGLIRRLWDTRCSPGAGAVRRE